MITLLTEKTNKIGIYYKNKVYLFKKVFALILSFFSDGAVLYDVQF